MKKFSISVLLVILSAPVFAGNIISVSGKVDVLTGGKWQRARVGMKIYDGTRIMTGVKGYMKVQSPQGTFSVSKLSMVTFHEKRSSKNVVQKIDMKMGKVHVKFTHIKGINASFTVKTPQGTASVRGTEKIVTYYPASGMDVQVLRGVVSVFNNFGTVVPTSKGQSLKITLNGDFQDKINVLREKFELDRQDWNNSDNVKWRIINDILDDVFDYSQIPAILSALNEPEKL
jgi:hypothetical protein